MRYRKLTPDGDFSFGAGQLDFYRDVPEAVGQAALTRLLLWVGEWFLDIDEGTPYMQGILGKHSIETANATIQDRILNTQGVTGIRSYESEVNGVTRAMQVNMEIDTIYGPTDVDLENYTRY